MASAGTPLVFDAVQSLTRGLVREFLARNKLSRVLEKFDSEHPPGLSACSTADLVRAMKLQKLFDKNKERSVPYKSLLELLVHYQYGQEVASRIRLSKETAEVAVATAQDAFDRAKAKATSRSAGGSAAEPPRASVAAAGGAASQAPPPRVAPTLPQGGPAGPPATAPPPLGPSTQAPPQQQPQAAPEPSSKLSFREALALKKKKTAEAAAAAQQRPESTPGEPGSTGSSDPPKKLSFKEALALKRKKQQEEAAASSKEGAGGKKLSFKEALALKRQRQAAAAGAGAGAGALDAGSAAASAAPKFTAPDGATFDDERTYRRHMARVFYSFHGKKDSTLVRWAGELDGNAVKLADLENCTVLLLDASGTVQADRLTNCRVFVAASSDSVFLRTCAGCEFAVACKQLRTRDLTGCSLRLYSKTDPIIERSSGVTIGPFLAACPGLDTLFSRSRLVAKYNHWKRVFDFNAGDPTYPMPHWTETPASERKPWIVPSFKVEGDSALHAPGKSPPDMGPATNPVPEDAGPDPAILEAEAKSKASMPGGGAGPGAAGAMGVTQTAGMATFDIRSVSQEQAEALAASMAGVGGTGAST